MKYTYFLATLVLVFSNATLFSQCATVTPQLTASQTSFCGPGAYTVSLTNTSTGANANSATTYYFWSVNGVIGDTTSAMTAPADINVTTAGTYTVQIRAIDSTTLCTDSTTLDVVVHPIPSAGFSFNNDNTCPGTTINFSNSSTGADGYTTYNWDFGDGNSSSATAPDYEYSTGGTFNIELVMTNGPGCTDTARGMISTRTIPIIDIEADDGTGDATYCLSPADPTTQETVTFTNNTTGAVTHLWEFDDGTANSNVAAPVHLYNSFGTFNVRYTATGANGCSWVDTIVVVFERSVSAAMSITPAEYDGCVPHMVAPTNSSVNATSYTYDFGDGTVINTTSNTAPSHTYMVAGNYVMTLTAINGCGNAVNTISTIQVVDVPALSLGFGFAGNGCAPQVVNFTNTSTDIVPPTNATWETGNGNTYMGVFTPPAQTYSEGTYQITLIGSNACGADTLVETLVVDSIPDTDLSLNNPAQSTVCSGTTVAFNNASTGASPGYQWYVDGVLTSINANLPDQTFTAPAGTGVQTHSVVLTTTNHCGSNSETVNVDTHPDVVARWTLSDDSICVNDDITYTDDSYGTNLTYNYSLAPDIETTVGPHTKTYTLPGVLPVFMAVDGFCGQDTIRDTIDVFSYPTINFTPSVTSGCEDLDVDFTNTTLNALQFNWDFGANSSPALSNAQTPPTITYSAPGTSRVYLTASQYGCSSVDSVDIRVDPIPTVTFTVDDNDGCHPHSTGFTHTSPNVVGYTYDWDYGNGNTFTGYTPGTETYTTGAADSNYDVKLEVTTDLGCVDSLVRPVTVRYLPTVDFTLADNVICLTEDIGVTNNSVGVATYDWDFGDGNNSTLASPNHTFATPGDYTIRLTGTTLNACSDFVDRNIHVDPVPTAAFTTADVCLGDTVFFTNNSTGTGLSYDWDFDDGSNSTLQTPFRVYTGAGNYNVKLVVTNGDGCPDSLTVPVTVFTVPTADFTWADTCEAVPTNFTNASTGTGLTYDWDFGDGNNATIQSPANTYISSGSYTVELITLTPAGCRDTSTQTVDIYDRPTASFTFVSQCSGVDVPFTNTSTLADAYQWDYDDGNLSTQTSPLHTYTTAATYNVTLTSTITATGCFNTVTNAVPVFLRSVPDFNNDSVCLGNPTSFTDITTNAPVMWEYTFGDGNPNQTIANPANTYAAPGDYNVKLVTETADGCRDSITKVVPVWGLPTVNFDFDTVCLNQVTSFTELAQFENAYTWNFGDGSPVNLAANPAYTFTVDGTFGVNLTVTDSNSCTRNINRDVIVRPKPTANFTNTTSCFSYPTVFTNGSTSDIAWEWDFGDVSTSTTENPSNTYAAPGTYPVRLIVENVFGCYDTLTQNVLVESQPNSGFTNTNVCAGTNVSFTDTTAGTVVGWSWDFGDGGATSVLQNPTYSYALGGTKTVTLITEFANGCRDTLVRNIGVFTNPTPSFAADTVCFGSATTFTNLSTDAVPLVNFAWTFGDGLLSNQQSPVYTYSNPGTYNVNMTVTNNDGCSTDTTIAVRVEDVPDADFNIPVFQGCSPLTINFVDNSTTVTGDTYLWEFGDGNTSTTAGNQTNIYTVGMSDSLFFVKLTITDTLGCLDSMNAVVNAYENAMAAFSGPDTVCINETVSYMNSSTNVVTYAWDFDNGDNSIIQNPSTTFTTPGSYDVNLFVSSNTGCTSDVTRTIEVLPRPIPDFSVDTVCLGNASAFTNLTGGMIQGVTWDFGDGNNSTDLSPMHTYADSGTYSVNLVVTNPGMCVENVTRDVIVYHTPSPIFNFLNQCLNDTVQFMNMSTGNITGINWDFGDGDNSTQMSPTHYYGMIDTFTVNLTVSNDDGCSAVATQDVGVYGYPIVDFSPDTVCLGDNTNFMDLTTDVVPLNQWTWNFGDGNLSSDQNPMYIFNNPGTHTVILEVMNNFGCISSDTSDVFVNDVPVPDFTADTACFGQFTSLSDLSTGLVTNYSWLLGDGNQILGIQNPTYMYNAPGVFDVTLIAEANGCSAQIIKSVQVYNAIDVTILANDTVCRESNFVFNQTAIINGANVIGYMWDFGDGNTSNASSTFNAYQSPGLYNVILNVAADNGCMGQGTANVVVLDLPRIDFNADVACPLTPVQFQDLTPNLVAWNWDFGDLTNTSTDQHPTNTYLAPGNYDVIMQGTDIYGCVNSDTNQLTVNVLPVSDFTSSMNCYYDTTAFTNTSTIAQGNIVTSVWDFGLGSISVETNPMYVFPIYSDTFNVSLVSISDMGCRDTVVNMVPLFPTVDFDYGPVDFSVCEIEPMQFNNNSTIDGTSTIVNQLWSFGDTYYSVDNDPVHAYDTLGNYTVGLTLTTSDGCVYEDSLSAPFIVLDKPEAIFTLSPQSVGINFPMVSIIDLSVEASDWVYDWGDPFNTLSIDPEPSFFYRDTGDYVVTQYVTSNFGCRDTAYRTVRVYEEYTGYFPNAFTPDGDGINDVYEWKLNGVSEFHIQFFNRWGELVYESFDPYGNWDGTYRGNSNLVELGVYIYKVDVVDINDLKRDYVGSVSVIR